MTATDGNTARHEEILASLGDASVPALLEYPSGEQIILFVNREGWRARARLSQCQTNDYRWKHATCRIVHLLVPADDEWVEVDSEVYYGEGVRRRRITHLLDHWTYEIHRDDLPEPVDERVEAVMEVLSETEQVHHAEVARQILAALDAMGGVK